MSHYWTPDDPAEVRRAQAEDWLNDLGDFDVNVVVEACAQWRRQPGGKRPTPGDIRALCIEVQSTQSTSRQPLMIGSDWRDKYARSVGFSSWLERQDAIAANEERYRLADEWRRSR